MSQKRIDPHRADRIKTLTICGFLPVRYHYKLQLTSNNQIHPEFRFMFGALPEHPIQVISNPELTKVHCRIISAGHTYQGSNYKNVKACLRCNINETIM